MIDTAELKVGFVTLIGVILFAIAVFSIKDYSLGRAEFGTLTATFKNISGVTIGSQVYLQGVKIGKVTHIRHSENNLVHVVLQIKREFARDRIRRGSVISIHAVGAISNEKYIDIAPDEGSREPFLDLIDRRDLILEGVEATGLSEILDSTKKILHSLEKRGLLALLGNEATQASATTLLRFLTDSGKNVASLTFRFNKIFQTHEQTLEDFFRNARSLSEKLGSLTTAFQSEVDPRKFNEIIESSRNISAKLETLLSEENRGRIDKFIDNAHSISGQIDSLLTDLGEKNDLARDIRGTVADFRGSAENLKGISQKVQDFLRDDQLENKLESTIESAKSMTEAVETLYDNLQKTEVTLHYFLKHDSREKKIKSDLDVTFDNEGHYLYTLGVEDIGDDPLFNLMIEERDKTIAKRGGIISSKVGLGFTTRISEGWRAGFDVFDTGSPKLRFNLAGRIFENFELRFKGDSLHDAKKRVTQAGVGYRF